MVGFHRPLRLAAVLLAGLAIPWQASSPQRTPFDLIVRGGSVLDGTGRPAYRADVGVVGSRIAKVGDLSRDAAATVIDARGLIVAPGFINIHSHAQNLSIAANMLLQGVTTEILNADGSGALDIARQLAGLETNPLAVNVGAYAPFNSAWRSVVGDVDRRPVPDEIARITALLEHGLQAGAWGVAAGLDYKPAYYARTEEVVAALSPLRRWRTNFPNHDRLTPEANYSSLAGMRETIEIGERAGLVPVITHMKLQGHEQGRADEALAMMRSAGTRGVYVAADVYPYLAGQTGLAALFIPGWAMEGGRTALLERLLDPAARARIVRETEAALVARVGGPENIRVLSRGRTVAELMAEFGTSSAGEAIVRILELEAPRMIATFGLEADLVKIIQYPDAAIACDCGAAVQSTHPRGSGSFPRVLGRYARDTKALPLADAVRKMTGLPATIIGMVDRGFITVGMAADLTVFDAAAVIDRATYERPNEPSEGIRFVTVNGRVALQDGQPTGLQAGQALRRTVSMSSRPMDVSSSRTLRAQGADDGRAISVDLARSRLRVRDGSRSFEGIAFGLLQRAPKWASLTGRLRESGTLEERAFVLIVDAAAETITLQIDGQRALVFTQGLGPPALSLAPSTPFVR